MRFCITLLGTDPEFVPTAEFVARANADVAHWVKVIKENNIKTE